MGISVWQILIVLLIILILFGAGKLPRVMGDMAKGIKSFKAGLKDDDERDEVEPDRTIEAKRTVDPGGKVEKDEAAKG